VNTRRCVARITGRSPSHRPHWSRSAGNLNPTQTVISTAATSPMARRANLFGLGGSGRDDPAVG
jgi:hypothetical protein